MRLHTLACAALVASAFAFQLPADNIPYPAVGTVPAANTFTAATSGDLVVYFYGSTAGYDDQLGVLVNGVQQGGFGLDNQTSTIGQSYDFGFVNAGDSLVFDLAVTPHQGQPYMIYSIAAMNSDGLNHAYATAFSGSSTPTVPAGTFVGIEDLTVPGSDLNFNDEDFIVTNVVVNAAATPEPATMTLLTAGILAATLGRKLRVR